jgi:DNA repair protein RadC
MNLNPNRFTIKQWAEDDRPREKMIAKGKTALSDAELLAIIIGSGNKEETALDLSKRILQSVNHQLHDLGKLGIHELTRFKGMGEAKAINVMASLELGKRRREAMATVRQQINSSKSVVDLMAPFMDDLPHEEFWILLLNRSNKVIKKECISRGGIAGTVADIRMMFKIAIENLSTGIIVLHNHPSGNTKPSDADIKLTKTIKAAGEVLDITLLDHVIIAEKSYFSFADEGLL